MTDKPENPPAYPSSNGVSFGNLTSGGHPGMTLRDWFAGQALAGWMAGYGPQSDHPCTLDDIRRENGEHSQIAQNIARCSYQLADAMLAERRK